MRPPEPGRRTRPGAAWIRLIPQAALVCCGIGALRFVEALVNPPPHGATPLLLFALVGGSVFWVAGALLGLVALAAWAVRRGHNPGPAPKPSRPSLPPTREMRLRGWGYGIVAAWTALSILVLIVMSETVTGPFAWIAIRVLGLRDFAGLATFLLGLPGFLSPLVLLAVLPWQARWPLIAGMQGAVKPVPQAHRAKKRP